MGRCIRNMIVVAVCVFALLLNPFGDNGFAGVSKVYAETVASGTCGENLNWTLDEDGVLTIYGTGDMINFNYSPWRDLLTIERVIIEDGVSSIGRYAFQSCTTLKSITIPDSVTSIGDEAFSGCKRLISITIPDSVTSIGRNAFAWCDKLTSVTIPDSVTSVGDFPFSDCSSLTSITTPCFTSKLTLGNYFGRHDGYNGGYVASIPSSLREVTITKGFIPSSFFGIGCSNLTSITITNGVTDIYETAFENCTSLTSITLPFVGLSASATGEDSHFYRIFGREISSIPSSLKEVTITGGPIGDKAFYNCSGITSITIPDSVTTIGNFAFRGCRSLTNITIPDSVTTIGIEAFGYCKLTSIVIPDSVTSIGSSAFSSCSLTSITIPDGVTSIGDKVFSGCRSLTNITIPDSVTTIGIEAFRYCNLTSIVIPDSVTSIGSSAFSNCRSLTSITIPDGVTSIGDNAFRECSSLSDVFLKDVEIENLFAGNKIFYGSISSKVTFFYPYEQYSLTRKADSVFPAANWIPYDYSGEHNILIDNNGAEATCTETGISAGSLYCDICNEYVAVFEVPALGHDFTDEWTTDLEATCVENGLQSHHCSRCDEKSDETVLPARGHDFLDEWTIDTEPTCTEDGLESHHCSRCDAKADETVMPALGHSFTNYISNGDATCERDGTKTAKCDRCDATDTIADPGSATGHTWSEPTWTWAQDFSGAEATFICDDCGSEWTVSAFIYVSEGTGDDAGFFVYTAEVTGPDGELYTNVKKAVDPALSEPFTRIAGSNRYNTGIKAADHLKETFGIEKFENIIIASGTDFPDALSGSYLAYRKNAPILLANASTGGLIADYVAANLADGGTVYLLGGSGAVPESVKSALLDRGIGSSQINRLGGSNRYSTNTLILDEAGLDYGVGGMTILVCCATDFADALSASAVGKPILLVSTALTPAQKDYLGSLECEAGIKFMLIGGTGAVSANVENSLKEYGTTERVAGSNRYSTSRAVAERFFPDTVKAAVLAYATDFPDGLSGASVAFKYDAPLLLATTPNISEAASYARSAGVRHVIVMGGPTLISDDAAMKTLQ